MDKVSIERLQLLHPKVRVPAIMAYTEAARALTGRAFCRVDMTLRTIAQQDALYAQGRTKPGPIVTNARGGASYHNYGLALDFFLCVDTDGNGSYESAKWDIKTDYDGDGRADWMEVVAIFEKAGFEWGGRFKSIVDYPHFQMTFGLHWQTLLERYRAGKLDCGYVLL